MKEELILTRRLRGPSKLSAPSRPQPLTCAVATLPNELLLDIFDLVYGNWYKTSREIHREFPYDLAVVCRRWLDLLLSEPRYWKRILIFLSGEYRTPLPVVHACMEAFDNLDVLVSVREDHEDAHGASESDLSTTVVIQAILPHIHRVKILWFAVDFSSSLPKIVRDLHGDAGSLQNLQFSCTGDDGDQVESSEDEYALFPSKFVAPNLDTLRIDGRNFVSACTMLDNTTWTRAIRVININHLRPSANEHKFRVVSAIETLSLLPCLEKIWFQNVDMSYDKQKDGHYGPYRFSRLTHLLLGNLGAETLAGFRAIDARLESLGIELCGMDDPILPYSECLSLYGINDTQNLAGTLLLWQGRELSLIDCSVFSDKFLQAMSGQSDSEDSEVVAKKMICPGLKSLYVSDCPNFAAKEFVDMLRCRQQWPENRFRIEQVHVKRSGPALSQEEGTWLRQNVDIVEWQTHQADGGLCRLAGNGDVLRWWDDY
ncbi:hypothetical protein BJ138DRAFT_1128633 [Hygrophoropsis aurantiaca]|uniref:Uncharacterized protein n=1 Tax=Hygrophoropsis aurantiaca TaxID=72124 RepID=A0ACB8A5A3_9AGAM|nr:hypothetical protein BJ138DRAFT_1128633 [Hygrophoropsis aurantiaca]